MPDLGIFAGNSPHDSQRERDQGPQDKDDADGAKRQSCCGVICYSHCVEEGEGDEHGPTEQSHCQQHIAHLQQDTGLAIETDQACTNVSVNTQIDQVCTNACLA